MGELLQEPGGLRKAVVRPKSIVLSSYSDPGTQRPQLSSGPGCPLLRRYLAPQPRFVSESGGGRNGRILTGAQLSVRAIASLLPGLSGSRRPRLGHREHTSAPVATEAMFLPSPPNVQSAAQYCATRGQ